MIEGILLRNKNTNDFPIIKDKIKIALISPKGPLYRHKGGIFKKSLRYQPLTLTTLVALIPNDANATVQVFDESISELPEHIDADLIGMTMITGTANRVYELAKKFKEQGKTVVVGGPHASLMPNEAKQHVDSVVVGYAEQTWPQLIMDYKRDRLQEFYYQPHDFNFPDSMPFPKRDMFDSKNFLTQAVFEATRSCIHDCEFCVAPTAWGRKQYQKPIDWVIHDISQFGAKKIIFVDLNLISDKKYAKELFTKLIPLKIHWFGLSTTLIYHDKELMNLMAESGCKGLLLGFESINSDGLKDNKKRFNTPKNYLKLINELHDLDISIQGCFVFGSDSDTTKVFDEVADFVIEAAIDLPRFAVLTPFPNTPLFTRLDNEKRIITKNWELYDGQHVVFQPKNMTPHELYEGHEYAWKKVYSSTSIIKRIAKSRTQIPLSIITNIGYRFYANNLHRFYNCDMQTNLIRTK